MLRDFPKRRLQQPPGPLDRHVYSNLRGQGAELRRSGIWRAILRTEVHDVPLLWSSEGSHCMIDGYKHGAPPELGKNGLRCVVATADSAEKAAYDQAAAQL